MKSRKFVAAIMRWYITDFGTCRPITQSWFSLL